MKLFQKQKIQTAKTKYIFLDIDGVLNTEDSWKKPYQVFDSRVSLLSDLCKETNAKIILISTWRVGYDKEYDKCSEQIKNLIDSFSKYGIRIYDITPVLKGRSRDDEIERFLYFHPCDSYIILDDDTSIYKNTQNIVKINAKTGLTNQNIKDAKSKLNH